MHPDVIEQVQRRAQLRQPGGVEIEAPFGAVAAGDLVVVARVDVDGRAAGLLRGARVAVVIEVAVRDEDAADVAERKARRGEPCVNGVAAFLGADAGVEERDTAVFFLDEVDVGGSARLGKGHRHRNPAHPEAGEARRHSLSFFTSSVSSGSTLKRSATRP